MTLESLTATLPEYLMRCGVPRATREDLAATLRPTVGVERARAWWDSSELTLLLLGGVGTGKTVAACSMLERNWRTFSVFMHEPGDMPPEYKWRSAIFVDVAELSTRSLFDEEAKMLRHRAQESELAILDDAGRERGDGAQALESIFMARFSQGRRTIITANLSGENAGKRLGDRVIDRIIGTGRVVNCGKESFRSV